jgi:hypothetical protein
VLTPETRKERQSPHAKAAQRPALCRRYGITLDHSAALADIHSGKARFVERQSHRVTLWLVEQHGKIMPVVYDKDRDSIATVLPIEHVIRNFPALAAKLNLTDATSPP